MPNDPKAAKVKRAPPDHRQSAQDDPEGSAHRPEEFAVLHPEMQGRAEKIAPACPRPPRSAHSSVAPGLIPTVPE